MNLPDHSPDNSPRVMLCGHCGKTGLHLLLLQKSFWRLYDGTGNVESTENLFTAFVFECSSCKGISLSGGFDYEEDEEVFPEPLVQWFPIGPRLETIPREVGFAIPGGTSGLLPEWLVKAYADVWPLILKEPDAFVMHFRRLLERICNELGAGSRPNLVAKLDYLRDEGFLPVRLVDATHTLRIVGNQAAHATRNISKSEAALFDSIFRDLVNYIYSTEQKVKALREVSKSRDSQAPGN